MSIKKQLFIALSDFLQQKVNTLQWVDKDLGQFELLQQGIIALPLPAVLISFPDTEYETLLGGDETADFLLKIRVGFENYYDANTTSPNRALALAFFDCNETIDTAVKSFTMQGIGGIRRVSEAEDNNHNNVIVTDIVYHITAYQAATQNITNTNATLHTHIHVDTHN